jgi:cyclohexadienyl dehydratase
MKQLVGCVLLGIVLTAATPVTAEELPSPEVVRLLDLIEHRARLMPEVARAKWHAGQPVTDPVREAAVLAAAAEQAAASGLDTDGALALVEAQMAIARDIQKARFDAWRVAGPPPPDGPDLVTSLRPAISATTIAILEQLPRLLPLLAHERAWLGNALAYRLRPLGATRTSTDALAAALVRLRGVPARRQAAPDAARISRLATIRARGELRVGTTGDYAPFSLHDGQAFRGIDIDLAEDLAAALGVRLRLVRTSWPTLMDDLVADAFDIAMSGISRTVPRQLDGDFSRAYHVGGKSPIIRCTDRTRFTDLDSIDSPGVRVVVNPGGTNEAFARARLTQATIRVIDDNRLVFREIAEGRADAMFTDAIEVRLQTAQDPRLCAAMPGRTLTYAEKGVLLQRDADGALLRLVDLWLAQRQGDGTLERIFAHHLGSP